MPNSGFSIAPPVLLSKPAAAPATTAPAAPAAPQQQPASDLTPQAFAARIVAKYPNGVASDGTPYAKMDATDLTQRIVAKYPDGVTSDGHKYSDFLPQTPQPAAPAPEGLMSKIGKGAMAVTDALGLHGTVDTLGQEGANLAADLNPTTSLAQKMSLRSKLDDVTPEKAAGAGLQLGSLLAPGGAEKTLASRAVVPSLAGAANFGGQAMTEGKNAVDVAKNAAEGAIVAPLVNVGGKIMSGIGKAAYKFAMPTSAAEANLVQAYRANVPFLTRVAQAVTGSSKAPVTAADTAFRKGLVGTEGMVGVQARQAASNLWSGLIKPQLAASKETVHMPTFFDELESQIKADNPELSRRNDMLEAVKSLREDYKDVKDVPLEQLQDFKNGWAKFVPQKAWQGKDISGVFNDVKDTAADIARGKIYKALGSDVRQAYLDHGNLQAIRELGQRAMTGQKLRGGTGGLVNGIKDMLLTPVTTIGGQTVYNAGRGVQLIGKSGAGTVGEFLKLMTSEGQQSPQGATDQQTTTPSQ